MSVGERSFLMGLSCFKFYEAVLGEKNGGTEWRSFTLIKLVISDIVACKSKIRHLEEFKRFMRKVEWVSCA
jgi:hypothetical protein